jgi:hypothetical protein
LGLTAGPDHERVSREDAWSNRETEQTNTGEVIRGRISLSEGEYVAQGFFTQGMPQLSWSVQNISGGIVNVWVLQESSFEDFEEKADSIEFSIDLSEEGISTDTERTGRVGSSEDWYVIFDNTSVYGTESEGSVEFDATVGIG